MDFEEKTVESEVLYDGKILKLFRDKVSLCNGKESYREIVHHNGGACVLAVDNGVVYLVSQYRYAYKKSILEIPAGKLEKDEDPKCCAIRELKEEIGATAKDVKQMMVLYPTPGYSDEKIYIYLAEGLKFGENHLDDGEFLDVVKVPYEKAIEMIYSNEINDSKTITALLMYDRMKNK